MNGQQEMHLQPTVSARHSPREPGDAHPDRIVHNLIGSDACAYTRQFQLSLSSCAQPISKVVDVPVVMHRTAPQVKTFEGLQVQVIDKTLPNTIGEADAGIKWCCPLCGYSVSGRQEDEGLRCEPARRQRVCHCLKLLTHCRAWGGRTMSKEVSR